MTAALTAPSAALRNNAGPAATLLPAAGPAPLADGLLIGYARVSTDDQKLDLQRDALAAAGVDETRIYEEYLSGVKARRPQLEECLKALRPGDVLVVWRLDRLGRNVRELDRIMEDLRTRDIDFRSLSEQIDTTSAVGKLVFHMMAAFAEFERNLISERTRAGLKAARLRGHKGGRPMKITPKKWPLLQAALDANITTPIDEVADAFDCSRSAVYRAIEKYADADWKLQFHLRNGHAQYGPKQ